MKSCFLLFSIFFLCSQITAADFGFRKYAGEFMEIGVDARAQALGGAFAAQQGEVTAIYYNPAGIYNLSGTQISFMHTQQMIASVNYDFLAFGKKQNENRFIAVSLVRLGIDNITDSRNARVFLDSNPDNWRIDPSKLSSFNSADYVFTFAVAQKWKSDWVMGASIKLIRRSLAEYSANGLGFDLGLQRQFSHNLRVGFNLKNALSTLIAWDTGEKELVKPALHSGFAYKTQLAAMHLTLQPAVEIITRFENRQESAAANLSSISFDYAGGMELGYQNLLFLRGGYDEIERVNFGVGIQLPHLRFDYAFTNYDSEIGNSHRIGMTIDL